MNKFILFVFCFFSVSAMGQDLTGIWRGHFRSAGNRLLELLGEEDRYKFEIQLDQKNKQFSGVTYSYKTTVFYGKAICTGAVNTTTKKVIIDELKIVELRLVSGSACIMTCFLQYSKSGDEEFLEGTYSSINTGDSTNCGRGTVFLRKVVTSDFYKEPFLIKRETEKATKDAPVAATIKPRTTTPTPNIAKKPVTTPSTKKPASTVGKTPVAKPPIKKPSATPPVNTAKNAPPKTNTPQKPVVKIQPPATDKNQTVKVVPIDSIKKIERKLATPKVLLTRENELVKTISTNANEIFINLYDNGSIDNDTVSVYLDKKLVITRQRLTDKPISIKFDLDATNTYHELVMVAENLGEIPPNTSLMVVKAGTKQYEVRITSNEQKNAVVIFKYENGQ